jgi:hypothetical protein
VQHPRRHDGLDTLGTVTTGPPPLSERAADAKAITLLHMSADDLGEMLPRGHGVPAYLPVVAVDRELDVADRLPTLRVPELGSPDDIAGNVDDLALGGLRQLRFLLGHLLSGGPLRHRRVPPDVVDLLAGAAAGRDGVKGRSAGTSEHS